MIRLQTEKQLTSKSSMQPSPVSVWTDIPDASAWRDFFGMTGYQIRNWPRQKKKRSANFQSQQFPEATITIKYHKPLHVSETNSAIYRGLIRNILAL